MSAVLTSIQRLLQNRISLLLIVLAAAVVGEYAAAFDYHGPALGRSSGKQPHTQG
jgi:hypothetical protein